MNNQPYSPDRNRLAISFWIWALWDTGTNGFFNDLELRMTELVERGFNCIRIEGGAGLTHDADGRPRGELEFLPAFPGYGQFTRQMEHMTGGRVDLMKRLVELCTVARRHKVKVILSSWYYLHTYWFTDARVTAELLGLPREERFIYFARGLDRILDELKQHGVADVIAAAEIFNEVDGLDFVGTGGIYGPGPNYGLKSGEVEKWHRFRALHEQALEYLKMRHPGIRFAMDTCGAGTSPDFLPRNAQAWNFHAYYLWGVYNVFEGKTMSLETDLNDPRHYAPVRRFLRQDLVPFQAIRECRGDRTPIFYCPDWVHRVWLYRNLDPNAMPELERLLQENLEKNTDRFKQNATDAVTQAVKLRDEHWPDAPLILGEGASYCADHRLRWEERSDAYWEVVEHAARVCRQNGIWGAVARTNSGPEDPVWHEYPERLQRVNAVFRGEQE